MSASARSMFCAELRSSVFRPTVSPRSMPVPVANVASMVTVPSASLSVVCPTAVVAMLAAMISPTSVAAGPVSVRRASPPAGAPLVVSVTSSISTRLPPLTVTETSSVFNSSPLRSTSAVLEESVIVSPEPPCTITSSLNTRSPSALMFCVVTTLPPALNVVEPSVLFCTAVST